MDTHHREQLSFAPTLPENLRAFFIVRQMWEVNGWPVPLKKRWYSVALLTPTLPCWMAAEGGRENTQYDMTVREGSGWLYHLYASAEATADV